MVTGLFENIFGARKQGLTEIALASGLPLHALEKIPLDYKTYPIPKSDGGCKNLEFPNAALRKIQANLLRNLVSSFKVHPASQKPLESGEGVLRIEIQNLFEATTAERLKKALLDSGMDEASSLLLARLTTHHGHIPSGSPTSARLLGFVNFEMDSRLAELGAGYVRDTDEVSFSHLQINVDLVKGIINEYGYEASISHTRK